MKIIKKGEIPEKDRYPKKKTCGYCKTQFLYEKSDVRVDSNYGCIDKYVICPHSDCGKRVTIEYTAFFAGSD
jgi:hypothetical protein